MGLPAGPSCASHILQEDSGRVARDLLTAVMSEPRLYLLSHSISSVKYIHFPFSIFGEIVLTIMLKTVELKINKNTMKLSFILHLKTNHVLFFISSRPFS